MGRLPRRDLTDCGVSGRIHHPNGDFSGLIGKVGLDL
jgi:hypothetical protein